MSCSSVIRIRTISIFYVYMFYSSIRPPYSISTAYLRTTRDLSKLCDGYNIDFNVFGDRIRYYIILLHDNL